MSTEFPSLNHYGPGGRALNSKLSADQKAEMLKDYVKQDLRHGRGPYTVNGVPISENIHGCCIKDPCYCRSDVIFYNGQAYDQKPFLNARLRTRPDNVMYLEGKLTPPFNPGKSPQVYGPYRSTAPKPSATSFNDNQFGKGQGRCCTSSIYGDSVPPYHNVVSSQLAYTDAGLPFGETIGYFQLKPEKICEPGAKSVKKLTECCTCEPNEYNQAEYKQVECPSKRCCC